MQCRKIAGPALDPGSWDEFIRTSPQGALFHLHGYLTACMPAWEAFVLEENGIWQAVMPIYPGKKGPYQSFLQAPFVQYGGICFRDKQHKGTYDEYSWKNEIVQMMAAALEPYHVIQFNFSPHFDYPLPFHWKGFTLWQRFTYRLDLSPDEKALFSQFAAPLQRQIKKAGRNGIQIEESKDFSTLLSLLRIQEQNGRFPLGKHRERHSIFQRLAEYLLSTDKGKLYLALNGEGKLLAAGLFGYHVTTCRYLTGAYDPQGGDSGAMSLLMWEAIRKAQIRGMDVFDFEGSMIEGIEAFFRKFGSLPTPYLQIQRNRLPFVIRWIQELLY